MTDVYEKIKVDLPEEKTVRLPQSTDDLTKIKGIGAGTAEKLNARKIFYYRQLAEITPEKLSEAPGIGVATAKIFIEEAKKLLERIQEQEEDSIKLPEPAKKEPVIVQKAKEEAVPEELERDAYEILENEVEEDFEPKEVAFQRNDTPYKQLLERLDEKIDNSIIGLEENETEISAVPVEIKEEIEVEEYQEEVHELNVEPFESEMSAPEKELPQERRVQKKWFSDKFNRSRLTASNPPVSERASKKSKVEIEEFREEIPEQFKNNASVEPFESEISAPEKNIHCEETEENYDIPTHPDFPEDSDVLEGPKIPEIPRNTNVPEIPKVPTRARASNRREELTSEVAESLKRLGYYSIPSGIEALRPFFQSVDYIGLKLLSVKNNSKLILLLPIKFCDLEGTILIDENKIDFKSYSKTQELELVQTARHYANDLLNAIDAMFEDVVNGKKFRNLFEKIMQVKFTTEKSSRNNKLYFVSSQTQYKVIIEPILLTKNPAKCMEKSILFPYQRKTNLHVIDRYSIANLLRFLEKKYQIIESRAKKSNSVDTYQNADAKFRSNLKKASLPFLGYSVVLLVIYFSQLYYLLRLFNSVGLAVVGVYFFAIAYFYFNFSKTKKELKTEFKTPYYLQGLQFSETDLLCAKEEFTGEQMVQFGYECFGKDNDYKTLEQVDKDRIKESVVARRQEREVPHLYELDAGSEYSSIKTESKDRPKNQIKYSSFLKD